MKTHLALWALLATLLSQTACRAEGETAMQAAAGTHQHTNHLIDENSPYLLSHAHNPVDWYPWGDEALDKAKGEDKPIFLSIGYAACHWCHVMERESFEDESIAEFLNANFVSIKVDREQRPDLDQIYMSFTTAMTGSGGWPMSVFLTPDLKPFFAGTYFPPADGYGRPSFRQVISKVSEAYRTQKREVVESAEQIFNRLNTQLDGAALEVDLDPQIVSRAARLLMQNHDQAYGGFGDAPKFPHALELSFLLSHAGQSGETSFEEAALHSLQSMARGGIYDHLGGGFARYSVDRKWLVPHFEKMLYDNGLLIPVYVEAFKATADEFYRQVATESLDWILREMVSPEGGFYSTLDADSEGEEGKFYVWSKREIEEILGDQASELVDYYNVTEGGNFDGHNILHVTGTSDRVSMDSQREDFGAYLRQSRERLLTARNDRVRPGTDDKILASWNGLAVTAFCKGYQVTGDRRYLDAATRNAEFVRDRLYRDGKLIHSYREGRFSQGEFLEDYAYYVRALLDLYESDDPGRNERWLDFAVKLSKRAAGLFMDANGAFYLRPEGAENLIMRPRDEFDGAVPAPGSIMIGNLFRLNRITGDDAFRDWGDKAMAAISGKIEQRPSGMASAVMAFDYRLSDKIEIVIVGQGDEFEAMRSEAFSACLPNRLVAASTNGDSDLPLFEGRRASDGEVLAFVCVNSTCRLPVSSAAELKRQLQAIR